MTTLALDLPISPRLLAAAPHRLLFLIGACNVLAAMAWWALWLVAARWQWLALPQPTIPAGWAHALVMPYQVLSPFVFGFLLTVFPRWMQQPPLTVWHYLPVGLCLLAGQAVTLVGLWGYAHLLFMGQLLSLFGWTTGTIFLFGVLWREQPGRTWHAVSCLAALALGWLGLLLALLWQPLSQPLLAFAAIKLGMFGFALPMYFTVSHRMFPFFASVVVPDYRMWRPLWALAGFWVLLLAHLALELAHGYAWLWLPDLGLTAITAILLARWWPRRAAPAILKLLFLGFAWLPIAFALYSAQSLWFATTGAFALGRAPLHALAIGYFGSLLVAMVTRVTLGHSGRPLAVSPAAAFAFVAIQIIAVLRVAAELVHDGLVWHAIAAIGWLLAFTPWVLQSARIVLAPRADRQPG